MSKKLYLTFLSLILLFSVLFTGCGIQIQYAEAPAHSSSPIPSTNVSASPLEPLDNTSDPTDITPSAAPSEVPVNLIEYSGIVEHLFFHPVIAYPALAFDGDSKEKGLDEYMLTVSEYSKILQSLYDNNYIIVSLNDVWGEKQNDDGTMSMYKNTLLIPEGKKPIVLSYDDVNYYNYMHANGFPFKLIVKDDELWSYGLDPSGKEVYTQDLDAITILDRFIQLHPDFSLDGVKGCLCLTGYEGILGYRTMTDVNNQTAEAEIARQREIRAVKPVVEKLKATGWYFGSHSWGHINLSSASLSAVQRDTQRWHNEVASLVGQTTLYFYPFGARPDGNDVRKTGPIFTYLQNEGFRVFASVGIEAYSKIKSDISAVICDRMHADGATLRTQRDRYLKFYDAKLVFDYESRPDYGTNWS